MNTKIGGKHKWNGLVALVAAVALTACGGGGGGGSTGTGTTAGGSTPPATGTTPPPATGTNPPPVAATQLAISSTSPTQGATAVALNITPRVVFNTRVDAATIGVQNPAGFTMRDTTNGNDVSGVVQLSADGMTATFTPRQNLVANAEYSVTVSTSVRSAEGTSLRESSTWTFTAAAPGVESTYPAAAATAVAVNTRVAAVFNTAVEPADITSFAVREAATGGAVVVGTSTYSNDGTRTAVFTPAANLQPNTAYTATITTTTNGTTSWTFTTGAQMDTVRPTVSFSPANNATNVGINSAIVLTFSEAVDRSRITSDTFFVSDASFAHLSGHIVIDAAGTTVTFYPSVAMTPSTPYHIIVKSDIRDYAGNGLDTGSNVELRSDFTTGTR